MKNRGHGLQRKKVIKQGESSSSNPAVTIHRDAARAYRKRKIISANISSSRLSKPDANISNVGDKSSDDSIGNGILSVTPAGVFIGLNPQHRALQ